MIMKISELIFSGYRLYDMTERYAILRKPGEREAIVEADGTILYGLIRMIDD